MLTANDHDEGEDLPSELAQPLEAVCSDIATSLIAQCVRFDDLNARYAAMQRIVTRAMCMSAREWNRLHDRLHVLPMELRAMCWSYLSQSDLVGLACVCSSWCDLSRGIPSLWTTLNVTGPLVDLDVLFSRSGRLPLHISVTVYGFQELAYADYCVGKHADRVRTLRVSLRNVLHAGNGRVDEHFLYPAPILTHFSFKLLDQLNYDGFHLSADIFNGHAPILRSLTLHEMPVPGDCPAFGLLTRLDMKWGLDILGLEQVFAVCPDLETLALSNVRDVLSLPFLPKPSKLRKITLTAKSSCFTTLRTRGYLDVPRLEVVTRDPRALYHGARYDDPSLHATLSIASPGVGTSELVLRGADGRIAVFTADDESGRTPAAVLELASEFPTLQRLVLPSAAPYCHNMILPGGKRTENPYLPTDLRLSALRTLALAHGAYEIASLLDPTVLCGVIRAPRLLRLEILRAANSDPGSRGVTDVINPGLLAQFIEQHIECDDPAALEVFASAEDIDLLDLADDEGIARLRRCVGKIIYGNHTL